MHRPVSCKPQNAEHNRVNCIPGPEIMFQTLRGTTVHLLTAALLNLPRVFLIASCSTNKSIVLLNSVMRISNLVRENLRLYLDTSILVQSTVRICWCLAQIGKPSHWGNREVQHFPTTSRHSYGRVKSDFFRSTVKYLFEYSTVLRRWKVDRARGMTR